MFLHLQGWINDLNERDLLIYSTELLLKTEKKGKEEADALKKDLEEVRAKLAEMDGLHSKVTKFEVQVSDFSSAVSIDIGVVEFKNLSDY